MDRNSTPRVLHSGEYNLTQVADHPQIDNGSPLPIALVQQLPDALKRSCFVTPNLRHSNLLHFFSLA
jgi:hypothetical protein